MVYKFSSKVFLIIFFNFALTINICAQKPPVAPVREVVDTYHGTKVSDPYRYMENVKDPEVQAWMKQHSDYTSSVLQSIPGREKLLKRIKEIDESVPAQIFDIQRLANGKYFYLKVLPNENVAKLYVREGLNGKESVIIDPTTIVKSSYQPSAINYFAPSPDGKYIACGISEGGSENASIYVVDIATGKIIDQLIDRAKFGFPRWLPSGNGFFYTRLRLLPSDTPRTEIYQKSRVYLHLIGTNIEKDSFIFGDGLVNVNAASIDIPWVTAASDGKHLIGFLSSSVTPEKAFYCVPISEINGAQTPWRKLFDLKDCVSWIDIRENNIFVLTFKDAPKYKLLKTSLSNPNIDKGKTIIPTGSAVLQNVLLAKDAIYAGLLDVTGGQLLCVPFEESKKQKLIDLPIKGRVGLIGISYGEIKSSLVAVNAQISGTLLSITSWTKAPIICEYNPTTNKVIDTKLQLLGKYDSPTDLVCNEVKVKSHDGVMVPLTIIHKRNIKLDGKTPVLLVGYGAYGFSWEPTFCVKGRVGLVWLEEDCIWAVAHVRGGGEYGEEWHQAGFQKTKPNTWKDFISCAEYLIEKKYTSSQFITGYSGSAGGILVGRALTERPDLFAAIIPRVGSLDMLRAETTTNGIPNIPEFGSVKTEGGFKALYEMSAYHQVKNNTPYPAVLLVHGVNDSRVDVWNSLKMGARLQAATSSNKPVLLSLDYAGGHGSGTTINQFQEGWADMFSFILWQCKEKDFQPTKR